MIEKTFNRMNPLTGTAASSARAMTPEEASAVAIKADGAFPSWAAIPHGSGRGADAIWRRHVVWLRAFRRKSRNRFLHRTALDHN